MLYGLGARHLIKAITLHANRPAAIKKYQSTHKELTHQNLFFLHCAILVRCNLNFSTRDQNGISNSDKQYFLGMKYIHSWQSTDKNAKSCQQFPRDQKLKSLSLS
jgi:hypothetical protein